jgi:DNA repair exonuclease SbcCD nuclease subunit
MKIAHISDTHLGRRPKQTRSGIVNQELRPLEDDFYSAWTKFVNEMVDRSRDRPDVILHCGDFFDTPAGYDPSPPPEYARKVAATTFKRLDEANIPLIIIDGNHGRYMEYRSSTLSVFPVAFNNIHLFTHYDARDSLRTQQPLFIDINNLNLRVITHPSIESRALSTLGMQSIYKNWIQLQNNSISSDLINISMAHGMIENSTLHEDFLKGNYQYIALGDDHRMRKVTDHAWYSGSTELWNFSEINNEKGYLMVELERGKTLPRVTTKKIQSSRRIILDIIEIYPEDTNPQIIKRVTDSFDAHGLNSRYEYSTAARVKIILKGKKTYGSYFNIGEVESTLRSLALDSDDYNIVEFILDRPDYPEYIKQENIDQSLVDNIEFLIEDPQKEFKEYVTAMRNMDLEKQNLDPNLLADIFAKVLNRSSKKTNNTSSTTIERGEIDI